MNRNKNFPKKWMESLARWLESKVDKVLDSNKYVRKIENNKYVILFFNWLSKHEKTMKWAIVGINVFLLWRLVAITAIWLIQPHVWLSVIITAYNLLQIVVVILLKRFIKRKTAYALASPEDSRPPSS